MPPEKELSRRIVAIVGAGSGIGLEVARRLVEEGATVAVLDISADSVQAVAKELLGQIGMGIGVAGSGISGSGAAIGLGCDVTNRASIGRALRMVLLAYGGLDYVVVTSGLYVSPNTDGPHTR